MVLTGVLSVTPTELEPAAEEGVVSAEVVFSVVAGVLLPHAVKASVRTSSAKSAKRKVFFHGDSLSWL